MNLHHNLYDAQRRAVKALCGDLDSRCQTSILIVTIVDLLSTFTNYTLPKELQTDGSAVVLIDGQPHGARDKISCSRNCQIEWIESNFIVVVEGRHDDRDVTWISLR